MVEEYSTVDEKFMLQALKLAEKGRGHTGGNPLVGAVIVRDGVVIGQGYHKKFGGAHGEVNALRSVSSKELIKGSTLYVTLEPCHHYGKTPPCTQAIVEAGISRVVFAARDEHDEAAGGGEYLAQQGIELTSGCLELQALDQNRIFFTGLREKRPYITVKGAVSLDGYLATSTEQSQWITSDEARKDSHRLRGKVDGIMVGTGTVLKDNPRLTNRSGEGKNPIRIILDRRGRIPKDAHVWDREADTLVFTTQKDHFFENKVVFPQEQWSLQKILRELKKKDIHHLMVEGGSQLLGSLVQENLVDEFVLYYAPFFMGRGLPLLNGYTLPTLGERRDFTHIHSEVLNDGSGNIKVEGRKNVYRPR